MGAALQVINGQVTNPGATVTALAANSGDSFTVRNAAQGSDVELLQAWAFTTTNLLMRIRSPLLHDQAQNMRLQPVASSPLPLLPFGATQRLQPQDNLTVELTGGAAEVDVAALLVYYANLPGAGARLHQWAEIKPLIANLTTVEVDVISSGTSGNYGATVPLNGTFDTLKRNVDYAILGYECAISGLSLGITGVDTSNLRVGGPLINRPDITSWWFRLIGDATGYPCIPVINSANVAGINLDVVAQATTTTFKVGVHLAQLTQFLPSASV